METNEILEKINIYLAANLPTLLLAKGLDDFDRYLAEPPIEVSDKELCVYLAEGLYTDSDLGESFIIQGQLQGVMNPAEYHSIIWKLLKGFDPSIVAMTTKQMTYSAWYPGEGEEGGSSSFLIYEIKLDSRLDDCDSDY